MKISNWKLCFIADAEAAGGRDLGSLTKEAVEAEVPIVQLRAKKLESGAFLNLAFRLHELLRPRSIPLIINDRIDIALACNAEGVHLGQKDIPLDYARKILGNDKIIGISVNTVKEAQVAEKGGATYLGVGPIFYTDSKENLDTLLGVEGLKKIRAITDLPLLAIGGVSAQNARDLLRAGADGIAVISAILGSPDIKKATLSLLNILENAESG